jgi:hypothetical protein
MDISLPILKSAALVASAEKLEHFEASEYSEEAELEDEMPDACKSNNKGENECA